MKAIYDFKTAIKGVLAFLLTWLAEKFLDNYVYDHVQSFSYIPFADKITYFFSRSFTIWQICVAIILFILAYRVLGIFISNNRLNNSINRQSYFRKKHEYVPVSSDDVGLVVKTQINFDENEDLILENIYPFCSKHGNTNLRMVHSYDKFECPMGNCNTGLTHMEFLSTNPLDKIFNVVEAELGRLWEVERRA